MNDLFERYVGISPVHISFSLFYSHESWHGLIVTCYTLSQRHTLQKPAPETGAISSTPESGACVIPSGMRLASNLWRRFRAPVSGACVRGFRLHLAEKPDIRNIYYTPHV